MSYILSRSLLLLTRVLLVIIILFGFFVKDLGENKFLGFSPAFLSLLCISITIPILLLNNILKPSKIILTKFLVTPFLFFVTLFLSISINYLLAQNIDLLVFYIIELISMILFFLLGYVIFDIIKFEIEYTYIISIVVLFSIIFLLNNLDLEIIRRIKTAGGVNFVANNYAIALIFFINGYFSMNHKLFHLFLIFISISLLFFMASKQAIFVALAGSIYVISQYVSKIRIFNFMMIFICVLLLLISYLNEVLDIELLLNRFNSEGISRSFEERFFLFYEMLNKVSFKSFFLGDLKINHLFDEKFDNPHNIFLSIFLYFGVFNLFLFIFSLVQILHFFLTSISIKNNFLYSPDFRVFVIIFLSLVSSIIYLSVSGHFTRAYHLFFYWGAVIKSIYIFNNKKKKQLV